MTQWVAPIAYPMSFEQRIAIYLAGMAITVAISRLVFVIFERPSMRWLRVKLQAIAAASGARGSLSSVISGLSGGDRLAANSRGSQILRKRAGSGLLGSRPSAGYEGRALNAISTHPFVERRGNKSIPSHKKTLFRLHWETGCRFRRGPVWNMPACAMDRGSTSWLLRSSWLRSLDCVSSPRSRSCLGTRLPGAYSSETIKAFTMRGRSSVSMECLCSLC